MIGTTLISDLEKTDKSIAAHTKRMAIIETEIALLEKSIPLSQLTSSAGLNPIVDPHPFEFVSAVAVLAFVDRYWNGREEKQILFKIFRFQGAAKPR